MTGVRRGSRPDGHLNYFRHCDPETEQHENFDRFSEARAYAKGPAQLGDDQIPFVQEIGPHKGRVTGMQNPDGNCGRRIDFDDQNPEKGPLAKFRTQC
ncbi:hypothetical protein ABZ819_30300 [Streptomyces venezuelae]|uniref:hypothetical protein n=1 Tax=Streptomyces venezuelae TaxID=54571 RepID=UPI00342BB053